jgi:hypothetical protein
MTRDYIDFQDRSSPVAYLITFRCYGTWLHGDERGSVDRHHRVYGTPGLQPSAMRRQHDRDLLKQPPVKLNANQRPLVESAIRETCLIRHWQLWTVNVRTNHVHAVVSAPEDPASVLSAFKANATRNARGRSLDKRLKSVGISRQQEVSVGEKQLSDAIAYVECDQGEPLD